MIRSIQLVPLALLVILASGCQTQSSTKISNLGSGSQIVESNYDRENAASKRVSAALAYLQRQDLKRAKYHLDKAQHHKEDYAPLHYALGFYYQLSKDVAASKKHFVRSLRLDDDNPDYMNAYAQLLCSVGDYEKAEDYFSQAIDVPTYSNIAAAYLNAGNCAMRQKKTEQASQYYRRALNINAKLPGPLLAMASLEFELKRYNRVKSYLKRYREVAPHSPQSLWLGLRTEHQLGDKDAVASYALQLEKLYPDSEETEKFLDTKDQWL
ncbi:type IV pilus biogenesis/stability protein PilW [Pleionea sp. CnH1-48]|uniref:type IV pilus biogenesis/stability protein PilW n=1 Tax=Pleionea sp. CnH1-48 TaxID=2954494 RepID=UPI002097756A|nr:type IV pilus biogenesis/stability protein PilW [Pleionea sp. CnH1-48]MCO7224770.1 type IV pilus biogenesis/stability protein PilW [Pleionea sp. CnH1-48]